MTGSSLVTKYWPADPSNYTSGRPNGMQRVVGIVIHHAASTSLNSIGTVFARPGRGGSAHYGVGGSEIHQYVDENDTAWHCGSWEGNCSTIGIETTNSTGAPNWEVSDETFETLCRLVADIAKRYNLGKIKFEPDGVYPSLSAHRDWAPTECPGPYLYARMSEIERRANEINYPSLVWNGIQTKSIVANTNNARLVDVLSGTTVKTYANGTKIDNIVEQATYNGVVYYRTEYSRSKGVNNGFVASEFKDYEEPKPEPTPEPTPEPEPTPVDPDDTPNWFIRFITALGEFFVNLFKKDGKE